MKVAALAGCMMLALLAAVIMQPITPTLPSLVLFGAAGLHLVWQVATLDINNPANCLRRFHSNRDFGLLVLGALLLQRFY